MLLYARATGISGHAWDGFYAPQAKDVSEGVQQS